MLLLAVVYLVASAGLAVGCRTSPDAAVDATVYPSRRVAMQRPVVRFTPPVVAEREGGSPSGSPQWYTYRNDVRASVTAGVRSPVLTRTYTRTHDRTSIHDGEARNHFHQLRRTEQVVETVR